MTAIIRTTASTIFAVASLVVTAAAQDLGRPTTTWSHDFSRIGGVAELPDGRVVVVDNLDQFVFLTAPDGSAVTQLGRVGDGPDEYRRPFSVVHGSGDTLLVYAQNRLVRITPAGTINGSIRFVPTDLGGSVGPPRGVDQAGRIYWDRPVIRDPVTNAIKRQQQYDIVRFTPSTNRVELVAKAGDHSPELHANRFHPFPQHDAWVVDPDGSLRIVRARNYTVDLVHDGRVVQSSAPIPFTPVPITARDREAYRTARAANAPAMNFNGRSAGGANGVTPQRMAQMREAYPDDIFPSTKPPFDEDGVLRSPRGELWVIRSMPAEAQGGGRVDVLDPTGRRIRELTLPVGRQLIALDRHGIYLVREDDDGLQYLERYAWPAGLQ